MKKSIIAFALLASAGVVTTSIASDKTSFSGLVDADGNIAFPEGFRTSMVHLGSWFVPDGGASGFHGVYTEKETVEAFRKTGKFPDGATLVKELRAHASGDFTTGAGVNYETGNLKQWFVMVKDTEGRFQDSGVWGDGWGWALFKPDNLGVNVSSDYKTDCLGCHIPAKDKDWIYTEAYPILAE
ncbi:cytochrome P460 family protein [Enterovibrio baiacu]|uniref:cytochrome P460 family protein n=1 Tax=Enterovibrio baiacu TaxID=2491023 RepID=UPI001013BC35|nr:cytochrome P460 family protein [Enterovibrio baiacu]MBE1273828.1 cytochrome C [Enterovibrio baiacu]